jgi:integrase/recombinase XerC
MNKPELSIARLEASLDAKISRYFDTLDTEPDVLKQLLAHKRSENTRRAYERDVNDFLKTMTGKSACPDNVLEFLHLDERQAVSVVLKYKAKLIDKGLKEATVNRRLAAVKSLVEMGRKLGACHYTLGDIKGRKLSATAIQQGLTEQLLSEFCSSAIEQLWLERAIMPCSGCCGVTLSDETKSVS